MTAAPAEPPTGRHPGGGLWRSVTKFSGRMPLRVKLIAALLSLVIAGLAVISIAGAFVLRDYLHTNTDRQVLGVARAVNNNFETQGVSGENLANCVGPYFEAFVPTGGQATCMGVSEGALPKIPGTPSWLQQHNGQLVTLPAISGNNHWRVLAEQKTYPTRFGTQVTGTLIVGESLGNVNATIGRLVSIDLVVGAVVIIVLAIVGVAVVRASLRPLTEIEQTAGEIAAGDLTKRVAERDPGTEVGSLGRSLNAMLARIEAAFHAQVTSEANARRSENRMRQFIADASHELRTPLTTIRGYAEYYRQRGGAGPDSRAQLTPADLDRIMHRVEDEADRMGILVEDLLLLARIDQQRPLEHRPVDMLALAADAVQDARMVAPSREVTLTVGRDTAFLVLGDEARLRQVVGNLVNNALTHTPDGTAVEVHVRPGRLGWGPEGPVAITGAGLAPGAVPPPPGADQRTLPAVLLEVADHGPGLTAEQAHRVFERFYRADQARTRKTSGGTGLGLAIVSALVSAHGGAVSVDSKPGQGARFRVALPLAPEAQGGSDEDAVHAPPADAAPGMPGAAWPPNQPGPDGLWARGGAQAHPGQAHPGQAHPGQAHPGQAGPGQAQPGQAQPGQADPPLPPWEPAAAPDVAEQRGWRGSP
jgi:two-component system OmpR family sensor kinase